MSDQFYNWNDDEITQPNFRLDFNDIHKEPKCECGAWKTYGEKISDQMHADWCPRKKKKGG